MSKYLSANDIVDRIQQQIKLCIERMGQSEFATAIGVTQPTVSNRLSGKSKSMLDLLEVVKLCMKDPTFRLAYVKLVTQSEHERIEPPETIAMSNVKIAGDLVSEISHSMLDGEITGIEEIDPQIQLCAEAIEHLSIYRNSLINKRNKQQQHIPFEATA